jgi:hypothetical protein
MISDASKNVPMIARSDWNPLPNDKMPPTQSLENNINRLVISGCEYNSETYGESAAVRPRLKSKRLIEND